METVAGGIPLPIPEGPFLDVLSRLSIKDLHRSTSLSREWRDVFINFPESRKNLPQTLQGFFYVGCDCRSHDDNDGGDNRDGDDDGDGARGDDDGGNGSDWDEDDDEDSSREVGHGRDRACSGNYGLRFFDLLAKSMPVPEDTDTEFSFIELPDHVGTIDLLSSCNGLLLFGCTEEGSESYHSLGYVVCNPATKQWAAVPSSGWVVKQGEERDEEFESTFLFFDPSVPSRFLLIQFWHDEDAALDLVGDKGVHVYSSETGEWSNRSSEWKQFARGGEWGDRYGVMITSWLGSSFLNGMLHFFVQRMCEGDVLVVAIDGEGSVRRTIRWPLHMFSQPVFIGQSQGRLRCVSERRGLRRRQDEAQSHRVTPSYIDIDVLPEDHDEPEESQITMFAIRADDYEVVAVHPHGDLVYFVHRGNGDLIEYDMGGSYPEDEQVLRLCNLGHNFRAVTPYVPCFSMSSALHTNEELFDV